MAKIVKQKDLKKTDKSAPAVSKSFVSPIVGKGGIVDKKVLAAGGKAEDILKQAQVEAEKIRAEAEKIKTGIESAREKAKKEGFESGREEGLQVFTEKVIQLEREREAFFEEAQDEVMKLVMSIAEKIIGKLVLQHEGIIEVVVRQALERAIGDRITVRLNPDDYKEITDKGVGFGDIIDRTRRLTFREDESIERGGCVVETEVGTIDARLETQLKAIRKTLGVG
ncbi:MAG: FliH/SctL family protein [Pseudomonadota bacterium]